MSIDQSAGFSFMTLSSLFLPGPKGQTNENPETLNPPTAELE